MECTRRSFVSMSSTVAVAGIGIGTASAALAAEAENWMPATWDYETDVLVIGYGGAGAAAAITCADEALCDVLVMEAAPEGFEGGNTRCSGNIVFIPDTVDGAIEYQTYLNGSYVVEENLMQAWAEAICDNKDWIESFGAEMIAIPISSPEFSEAPSADQVKVYCVDGHFGDESLWTVLKEQEEFLEFPVLYGTRATELIRNPLTNEALGAIGVREDGTTVTVKARRGVILSCGGFENNPELGRTYYHAGAPYFGYYGSPYNRGDGFALVEPFGAKLWHMNSFSGGQPAPVMFPEEGYSSGLTPANHAYIYVGEDSSRFVYEETIGQNRHGKLRIGGAWTDCPAPGTMHMIMGASAFEQASPLFPHYTFMWPNTYGLFDPEAPNNSWVDSGLIVKADTVEELAEKLDRDPTALAETIDTYNQYCADGYDPIYHRGEAYYEYGKMSHFDFDETSTGVVDEKVVVIEPFALEALEPPFYAIEMRASYINTQGGPKRNENCQIVNSSDEPISRLYGTGEFGSIYAYMYNGGGNVSEAIATGRVAARHAASNEPWDA